MKRYINQLALLTNELFSKYKKQINTKEKVGVLVSGGIDSSIIAYYCQKYFPKQTVLFSFGSSSSKDKPYVDLLQKHLKLPVNYLTITQESVNAVIPTVKQILQQVSISNFNPPAGGQILNSITHLSLATGYYLIFQEITKHQIKTVLTGQGPDVLMAGYNKYKKLLVNSYELLGKTIKSKNIVQETVNNKHSSIVSYLSSDFRVPSSDLSNAYNEVNKTIENDLEALEIDKARDNTMANYHNIQLYNPYLEQSFIDLCLSIPSQYKLVDNQQTIIKDQPFNSLTREHFNYFIEKYIERLWGNKLGLPDEIVWRPKMAFQYSTQVQKLVEKSV